MMPELRGPHGGEASSLDNAALYRLVAWLSPAYPTGAFSYSSGIEWAVEAGDIHDADTLGRWLLVLIGSGSIFSDAVLLAHAYHAAADRDGAALRKVAELALAFTASWERHVETTAQGRAFLDTTRAAWSCPILDWLAALCEEEITLPIAVAAACAGHRIPLAPALGGYIQSQVSNLISAGVRLIPLGQTDGQRVLAMLEPVVTAAAERALATALDELGAAAFRADIAGMRHETQYTRLFRS